MCSTATPRKKLAGQSAWAVAPATAQHGLLRRDLQQPQQRAGSRATKICACLKMLPICPAVFPCLRQQNRASCTGSGSPTQPVIDNTCISSISELCFRGAAIHDPSSGFPWRRPPRSCAWIPRTTAVVACRPVSRFQKRISGSQTKLTKRFLPRASDSSHSCMQRRLPRTGPPLRGRLPWPMGLCEGVPRSQS